jgi:putative oxidoreductase
MNTRSSSLPTPAAQPASSSLARLIAAVIGLFERIPHTLIALVARFSIAAVFWNSGQTKIEGLAINFVSGEFVLGWPRLSDTAVTLFQDEYKLPFLRPELAAPMAALAEHVFPLLILVGLATRFSALALLGMALVIQVFVYPGAYATHGTWAAVLLVLMARGPGKLSVDHWLARRHAAAAPPRRAA